MADIENLVNGLTYENDKYAYSCLRELEAMRDTNSPDAQ